MRRPWKLGCSLLLAVVVVLVVVLRRPATGPVLRTVTVGYMPGMVAVDERTNHAFVTNSADHTVTMLDASNGTVVRTVALSDEPDVVAADARTGRIFVLTDPNNTVCVLGAATGAVLATFAVTTEDLAVSDRSGRVFVSGEPYAGPGTVAMLDGTSGAVLHNTVVGGSMAWGIAVDDFANRVLVTDASDNSIVLVDASTGRVVRTIAVGSNPAAVAVDVATGHAFVTNNGADTVTMLDVRTGVVLRVVKVGFYPARVVVDQRAGHVFLIHGRGGSRQDFPLVPDGVGGTTMLDARSGSVLRTLSVGASPVDDVGNVDAMNIAVDEPHGRVYIINQTAAAADYSPVVGSVSVLDAGTGHLLRTLTVGRNPIALAVDTTSGRLFVVNTNSGCVPPASIWDHVRSSVQHVLRFLPAPSPPVCPMHGSVTVIDTSRL
jgi:YVTN family beta-propeller protein